MKIIFRDKKILFFILMVFFKPLCFQYYSKLAIIEKLYVLGKIAVAGLVLLYCIMEFFPKVKFKKSCFGVILFEGAIVISTCINKGDIFRAIIDFVSILVLVLIITFAIKENSNIFLEVFSRVLFTLILLQFGSEILYPGGMPADLYTSNFFNPLYFVTLDNGMASLLVLTMSVFLLRMFTEGDIGKKKMLVVMVLCFFTAIGSGSSTAIICTTLLILIACIIQWKQTYIFDKPWIWQVTYFCMVIMVLGSSNLTLLNWFLKAVFNKSAEFTGRSYLWTQSIMLIKRAPFIGYGRQSQDYLHVWGAYYSSHSVILEIMLQGGIVALFLWGVNLVRCMHRVKKCTDYRVRRVIVMSIFVVLVALMMEAVVHSVYLFSVLAISYNCIYLNISLKPNEVKRIEVF